MYDYCDQDCNDDDVNDIRIIMTSVMTYENENNEIIINSKPPITPQQRLNKRSGYLDEHSIF